MCETSREKENIDEEEENEEDEMQAAVRVGRIATEQDKPKAEKPR
ncbi:MAG: hypothetical protein OXH22_09370 [Chloroflexi bacterium]|nr:hypothetical protein [Chloroflexota bacterium]